MQGYYTVMTDRASSSDAKIGIAACVSGARGHTGRLKLNDNL